MEAPKTPSELYKMISIPEAQQTVLRETPVLAPRFVSLAEARGHVLAADVTASEPLPPFPASIKVVLASHTAPTLHAACVPTHFHCLGLRGTGNRMRSAAHADAASASSRWLALCIESKKTFVSKLRKTIRCCVGWLCGCGRGWRGRVRGHV